MTSISRLPQMNAFQGMQTMYVPAHLVFSPDEPVFDPEARMRLWMVKNFHKEWIFMIVSSHKPCKVDVSLYAYA